MNKNKLEKILCDAYYEEMKQELSSLPSDEELRRKFPVTKEKRDEFIKRIHKKKKPAYIVYLQRAAAFLLIFSAVVFGVIMTNSEIRADILQKGIKLFDQYMQFDFSDDKSDYTVDFDNIKIGYIPEKFELIFSACFDDFCNYTYTADDDHSITITVSDKENIDSQQISDSFIDLDPITIDGFSGYSSYDAKDNCSLVVWGNKNFQVCVYGTIELDEALKTANGIEY